MKHLCDIPELTPAAVQAAALSAGVPISLPQAALMVQHATQVVAANQRMNLTRITAPEDVLALHIVDSLAFLPHTEPLVGHIVDIGSGAGYPGVPLAILGLDVCLCESVKKKAAFLEAVVSNLGLSASVHASRAEELALIAPGSADFVIARAVSTTPALLELASPLLRKRGRLVALKGLPNDDELAGAAKAARMCGMREVSSVRYTLPTGERRMVLVFERVGKPRVALPRRPGSAQRQPLG